MPPHISGKRIQAVPALGIDYSIRRRRYLPALRRLPGLSQYVVMVRHDHGHAQLSFALAIWLMAAIPLSQVRMVSMPSSAAASIINSLMPYPSLIRSGISHNPPQRQSSLTHGRADTWSTHRLYRSPLQSVYACLQPPLSQYLHCPVHVRQRVGIVSCSTEP